MVSWKAPQWFNLLPGTRQIRTGNWLPTGGIDKYLLVMRLYDTPVGVATRGQRDAPMPQIATTGCP